MINGFVIEIVNTGESEESITLFRDRGIAKGIQIKVVNADYDYASLLAMAKQRALLAPANPPTSKVNCRLSKITVV